MATTSTLLPHRRRDFHSDGFHEWPFMTVHNWGEDPRGDWKYIVTISGTETQAELKELTVILFGVKETPRSVRTVPVTCHPECLNGCAGEGPEFCDTCRNFRIETTFECVLHCPMGTYIDHHMCRSCPPYCSECDKDQCYECVEEAVVLTNGECSLSCEPFTYLAHNGQCQPCHPSCQECFGPEGTSCTTCPPQYIHSEDGQCVIPQSCQEGEYFNSRSLECRPCHESCAECVGKGVKECTECYSGFELDGDICSVVSTSSKLCPAGKYFDKGSEICKPCSANCERCTDEVTCLSCDTEYYLWTERVGESQLEVVTCVDVCPKGFHGDEASLLCQSCPSYCIECDSHDLCTLCTLDFAQPVNGQCPQPCHDSEYFDFETSHCLPCLTDCLTCRDRKTCLACKASFYLVGDTSCVAVCPEHLMQDDEHQLCRSETCHETCKTCFGEEPDQCLTCYDDGVLLEHSCTENCPSHTYYDEDSLSCQHCHDSCRSCAGPNQDNCLECPDGEFLNHYSCMSSCPEGTFVLNDSECVSCPANCRECSSPAECLVCDDNFLREEEKCVDSCSKGFTEDEQLCKPCPSGCEQCSNPLTCDTCSEGKLYYKPEQSCLDQCPPGYYPHTDDTILCRQCSPDCSECTGPDTLQCTVCNDDSAMDKKSHTCTPCCNPDHPNNIPCCDCDTDNMMCVLVTTPPSDAAVSHDSIPHSHGTALPVTIGLVILISIIMLAIALYYLITRLRRRTGGVLYKPLHRGELATTLALIEESESGSEAELFAKAGDT